MAVNADNSVSVTW